MFHLNTKAVQQCWIADAGKLQQMRRIDGATGNDHLTRGIDFLYRAGGTTAAISNAGGTLVIKQNFSGMRVGDNGQIGAAFRRF